MRQTIEDFFRATANYARTYPIYLGNMDPILIRDFAIIGRVIGEPEFVHDALRRAELLMQHKFYPDGLWYEGTPDYNAQVLSWLIDAVRDPLQGYSDPAGYVNPIDHRHLVAVNAMKDLPHLAEAVEALNGFRLPNGERITVHDAFSAVTLGKRVPEVGEYANVEDGSLARAIDTQRPDPFGTRLYWAAGEAVLGLAQGSTGVQADLHFGGGGGGHAHFDPLDLVLFGDGREFLPDIGYTHTIARPYVISALAHNVVVVDARNPRTTAGRLAGWGVAGRTLRFAEADDAGAYPEAAPTYRRALAVVSLPRGGAYVLDVFRVAGGRQHDWLLHGGADFPNTLACSLPLQADPAGLGPAPVPSDLRALLTAEAGTGAGDALDRMYGLFGSVQSARTDDAWTATFRDGNAPRVGLRTTMLGQPGTTVYCGTLPSVRPAHEDNRAVLGPRTPVVLVRRRGRALASTFVAVHEPFTAAPQVTSVRRLPLVGAAPQDVGLMCRGEAFDDYFLCGRDVSSTLRTADNQMSATGRFAFVRTRKGKVVKMVLVDGTDLRFGGRVLTAAPAPVGAVTGTEYTERGDSENALVVTSPIPPRPARAAERVIVTFGDGSTYALAVRAIRTEAGRTAIVLGTTPGFTVNADGRGGRQTYFPHRTIRGIPTFRLPVVAQWPGR